VSTQGSFWRNLTQKAVDKLGLDLVHIQTRYGKVLLDSVESDSYWLDIGCGRQLFPSWAMPSQDIQKIVVTPKRIVGIDFDNAILDHPHIHDRTIGSGYTLPFAANSFHLVTANMVMEHLDQPQTFLAEVARVLKPGGKFVFVTPNKYSPMIQLAYLIPDGPKKRLIWFIERRHADDVFPTYYRANRLGDLEEHSRRVGLAVHRLHYVNSIATLTRLGPIGFFESLFMGCLPKDRRTNILGVLEKPLRPASA